MVIFNAAQVSSCFLYISCHIWFSFSNHFCSKKFKYFPYIVHWCMYLWCIKDFLKPWKTWLKSLETAQRNVQKESMDITHYCHRISWLRRMDGLMKGQIWNMWSSCKNAGIIIWFSKKRDIFMHTQACVKSHYILCSIRKERNNCQFSSQKDIWKKSTKIFIVGSLSPIGVNW